MRGMNGQVAEYRGLVESLADELIRRIRPNALVDRDDLVQEGLIDVWQSLQRGIKPSRANMAGRMKDYIKWAGNRSNTPYETANPLEDYRGVSRPEVPGL